MAKKSTDSAPAPRTFPRGFGSNEAAAKVRQAVKSIVEVYPSMSEDDARHYLAEVGAGRYLALANYAPKAPSLGAPRDKLAKAPKPTKPRKPAKESTVRKAARKVKAAAGAAVEAAKAA